MQKCEKICENQLGEDVCTWPVKRESGEIQWMTFTVHMYIVAYDI